MPQFMVDWNNWWMSYWADHPVIFWVASVIMVGVVWFRWKLGDKR